jgi:tetratricopeptide (TPR) repeat protein
MTLTLCMSSFDAGRAGECESLYRQALALCPTYPSAHYNLGVLASEGRRWLDALQHYKDTLALAPHHAQVRVCASVACCADLTSIPIPKYGGLLDSPEALSGCTI